MTSDYVRMGDLVRVTDRESPWFEHLGQVLRVSFGPISFLVEFRGGRHAQFSPEQVELVAGYRPLTVNTPNGECYLQTTERYGVVEGKPELYGREFWAPATLNICPQCGAAVADRTLHDVWHAKMVR